MIILILNSRNKNYYKIIKCMMKIINKMILLKKKELKMMIKYKNFIILF